VKEFEAAVTIDAPADSVWAVLTDGAGYPTWESGVERVEGAIAPGETIKVVPHGGRAFPVEVTEFSPSRSMTWKGGLPLGLLKGVRRFTLTPLDGGTQVAMREEFTGPLVRVVPDLQPSFDQFARGLKAQVERRAG
jgi:hypothetical protein